MESLAKKTNPFIATDRVEAEDKTKADEAAIQGLSLNAFKNFISRLTEDQLFEAFDDFKAAGSEHMVFELKHQDGRKSPLLLKINYLESDLRLLQGLRRKQILPYIAYNTRVDLVSEKQKREAQQALLRKYFNTPEHKFDTSKHQAVPGIRYFIADVPLTKELVHETSQQIGEKLGRLAGLNTDVNRLPEKFTFPALVSVQKKLEFSKKHTFSLCGGNLEAALNSKRIDPAVYVKAHDKALGINDAVGNWIAFFDAYPTFETLSEEIVDDADLERAVREMTSKMMTFVQETGIALDVIGAENVIMNRTAKGWRPYLLDALPIGDANMIYLQRFINKIKRLPNLDRATIEQYFSFDEATDAFFALNSLRCLNALAEIAGPERRITVPGLRDIPAETWLRIFNVKWKRV